MQHRNISQASVILLVGSLSMLSACGGGGSAQTSTPTPTTPASIDTGNTGANTTTTTTPSPTTTVTPEQPKTLAEKVAAQNSAIVAAYNAQTALKRTLQTVLNGKPLANGTDMVATLDFTALETALRTLLNDQTLALSATGVDTKNLLAGVSASLEGNTLTITNNSLNGGSFAPAVLLQITGVDGSAVALPLMSLNGFSVEGKPVEPEKPKLTEVAFAKLLEGKVAARPFDSERSSINLGLDNKFTPVNESQVIVSLNKIILDLAAVEGAAGGEVIISGVKVQNAYPKEGEAVDPKDVDGVTVAISENGRSITVDWSAKAQKDTPNGSDQVRVEITLMAQNGAQTTFLIPQTINALDVSTDTGGGDGGVFE